MSTPNNWSLRSFTRTKTVSECSDASDADGHASALSSSAPNSNFLYDLDGKVAFSYYGENKDKSPAAKLFGGAFRGAQIRPEATISEERVLYDIDGKFAYTVYDPQKAKRK